MLDVHPPRHAAQSWRDFFVHIATIVIGLLIAVGLEQAVEFVHHRHQRDGLEEQMRDVLAQDRGFIARDLVLLTGFREYLVEVQIAIAARLKGQNARQPTRLDPRTGIRILVPNLAPYQAAKENGTVALLDSERIGLFNRVAFQREVLQSILNRFMDSIETMDAFRKRYDYSQGSRALGLPVPTTDISSLNSGELVEYRSLVAATINATDEVMGRLSLMDVVVRVLLDGARNEGDLMARVDGELRAGREANDRPARADQP